MVTQYKPDRRLTRSTIRWCFRLGMDSFEIAKKYGVRECDVWNAMARAELFDRRMGASPVEEQVSA